MNALRKHQTRADRIDEESGSGSKKKTYELVKEVDTRWNSTYFMLKTLQKLKWFVRSILSNSLIVSPSKAAHLEMRDAHWSLLDYVIPILRPFAQMMKRLSGYSYPTCSLTYTVLGILQREFDLTEDDSCIVRNFKYAMNEKMQTQFFFIEWCKSIPVVAAVFDPRFKLLKIH